jgi:plasmid stabilization system protein ParE
VAKKARGDHLVYLTVQALRDLVGIEAYSAEHFGKKVADQYIAKIEAALNRIGAQPDLLREEPSFHKSLRFYRVEKHVLVCETAFQGKIILLTVLHSSMDIPSRLTELEPNLALEAELLMKQLQRSSKS